MAENQVDAPFTGDDCSLVVAVEHRETLTRSCAVMGRPRMNVMPAPLGAVITQMQKVYEQIGMDVLGVAAVYGDVPDGFADGFLALFGEERP